MKKYIATTLVALLAFSSLAHAGHPSRCNKSRHHSHRSGPNEEWSAAIGFVGGLLLGSNLNSGYRQSYYNNNCGGYYRTIREYVPGCWQQVYDSCRRCYVRQYRPGYYITRRVWVGY